jgi:hypothetical protein
MPNLEKAKFLCKIQITTTSYLDVSEKHFFVVLKKTQRKTLNIETKQQNNKTTKQDIHKLVNKVMLPIDQSNLVSILYFTLFTQKLYVSNVGSLVIEL